MVVQRRGNLLVGARQRANLGTALDDAHRENAVDVAKAGNLRVAAPAQHVGGLGKLGFLCPDWSRKCKRQPERSEEHTSELQSLMRISYAVFCLKKKNTNTNRQPQTARRTDSYINKAN